MLIRELRESNDAFRDWFGLSKVVDDSGEPLVVYHGTSEKPFARFDANRHGARLTLPSSGLGIFFSPSSNVRHTYGSNVLRAYLKIENPFSIRLESLNRLSRADVPGYRKILIEQGYDGIFALYRETIYEYVVFDPDQVSMIQWDQGLLHDGTS